MLKNHQKELMDSINNFLDNILNINNLFKKLLESYFKKILMKLKILPTKSQTLKANVIKLEER